MLACGPVFFKCDVIDCALWSEVTIGECQEGVGDAIFATGTADVRARRMCGTVTSDDVDMSLAMPVPSRCTRKELRKKRHPRGCRGGRVTKYKPVDVSMVKTKIAELQRQFCQAGLDACIKICLVLFLRAGRPLKSGR